MLIAVKTDYKLLFTRLFRGTPQFCFSMLASQVDTVNGQITETVLRIIVLEQRPERTLRY